jgi:hypothetical protein
MYALRSRRQAAIVPAPRLSSAGHEGMANHLYYGDNLEVLREHIGTWST